MKTIAIDIDKTWSIHPQAFSACYNLFRSFEFRAIVITRHNQPIDKLIRLGINTSHEYYCSNGVSKKKYLDSIGIKVDVWIDDDPSSIIETLKDDLK